MRMNKKTKAEKSTPEPVLATDANALQANVNIAVGRMTDVLTKYQAALHTIITDRPDESNTINYVIAMHDPENLEVESRIYYDADEVAYDLGDTVNIHIQFVPLALIDRFTPAYVNVTVSGPGQGK